MQTEIKKVADYWRFMVDGKLISSHRTKAEASRAKREFQRYDQHVQMEMASRSLAAKTGDAPASDAISPGIISGCSHEHLAQNGPFDAVFCQDCGSTQPALTTGR